MNIPGLGLGVPMGWVGDEKYIVVGFEKGRILLNSGVAFSGTPAAARFGRSVPKTSLTR